MIKHILLSMLAILIFSCGNPCDDIDCGANGTCNEDSESCICDDWYEGTNCETALRTKFIGTWASTSPCSLGSSNSDPTWVISEGPTANAIIIQSTDVYSNSIFEGTLQDANNVTITPVTIGTTNVTGDLKFQNETTLSMNLNIEASTQTFDCTYPMTK